MNQYVTGAVIQKLRERNGDTQRTLAEKLSVSDKTISKWETGRGLPDITLLEPLARALHVSVAELLSGECITNQNRSGNMRRIGFYVCPICGNVIYSMGEGVFSCCGVTLPRLSPEPEDTEHTLKAEKIEYDHYVTLQHPMTKEHYISFAAYVTYNQVQLVKLYPEQNPEVRFPMCGSGIIYVYCNRHGLFQVRV
ncbi:MAG: helix-turn-helix domain-containing protein [Ruminococcus sp.]|nr:helix-turn-helix domain-containing protein [Ruminococcus sp.]